MARWAKQGKLAVEWGENRVVFFDLEWGSLLDLSPDSNEDEEACGDFATAHLGTSLEELATTYDGAVREATLAERTGAQVAVADLADYWYAVPGYPHIKSTVPNDTATAQRIAEGSGG